MRIFKTYLLSIATLIIFNNASVGQVLCIYCYDQNDSISSNVNNLIVNGGFENTNCIANYLSTSVFCPNSMHYSCDIANWICTGGGTNTYCQMMDSVHCTIVEGHKAVYFGNNLCNACSNTNYDTSCLNDLNCTVAGIPQGFPVAILPGYGGDTGVSLQQTVSGLTVGNTYVLEFWAGGEWGYTHSGLFAVDVGFGDTLMRNKSTDTGSIGTRFIIEFNAVSNSHTIKFTNWGHISSYSTELVLDDVKLYTLAELNESVNRCSLTGINEMDNDKGTSIYPNPSNNSITISPKSAIGNYELIITDVLGNEVYTQPINNSNNLTINISKLSNGVYFYHIRNDKETLQGKFVVEK